MAVTTTIRDDVDEILPGVVADRRHLHEHPELAFEEVETARFVVERLKQLGVEDIKTGIGGTGVTALIHGGKGPGKVAMLRADMDALPIEEENDVDYKSTVAGKMHACGHDAHTAMLLGTARVLMDRRGEFAGTVKLLFQPAEEVPPGGAIAMIKDGALENPRVDAVFGLHVAADMPAGQIGVREGAGSAGSDRFRAVIQGKGGHAARPQAAIDPVVIASQIVLALQTLVAREVDPMEAAVVSTTAIQAGEAFNVIPDTAELRGTVRTLSPAVREHLQKRVPEVIEGIGTSLRAEVKAEFILGYPGIVNDPEITEIVRQAAIEVAGEENVVVNELGMGGEDFSYFSLERPGCFFRVGTRNEERGIVWGHHHPKFDVEEEGMINGMATMANAVLKYLSS
ncbi:MAG TPA: amidohydrolase [Thermomicrobiales bacterium]|nr:amidohydrolase [Thermomicrobiales bacterium]